MITAWAVSGSFAGIPEGSVNSNYLLETAKGRFLLRIDEVKGENEVKREIDLLSFLRKHSFPCPHPMQDRMGRYYREFNSKCVSMFRYHEGRVAASRAPAADPAGNHRPHAGRVARHRQGLQKGHRQPLQLRAGRRSLSAACAAGCRIISAR